MELRIAPRTVAGAEKKFCRDDPRVACRSRFSFWLGLAALSVAATLSLPLLLAIRRPAIASPGLPRPPLPRLLTARLTTIACQWLLGPELPPTALQQTIPIPRTACPTRENLRCGLIFRRGSAIFIRGHGRAILPEAQVSKGNCNSPSGRSLSATRRAGTSLHYPKLRSDQNQ